MSMILREDIDDGIVIVTLNRPESLNALSPDLFVELNTSIQEISNQTDSVACVILRGAGRCFSAGNDLKAVAKELRQKKNFFKLKLSIYLRIFLSQPLLLFMDIV